MKRSFDLAIVGAGFGGSIMAMVARRLGLSVVLLEQGRHPRVVIGESTTPLSNLLLERLCETYDLPRIAPLAKWGTWQRAYPGIACGLKRGFTFFHHQPDHTSVHTAGHEDQLLVAASPHDEIADTHWYRADVDHFLALEAQGLGVSYLDRVSVEALDFTQDGATLIGRAGQQAFHNDAFHLHARFVIDATGPRGLLHRMQRLQESTLPGLPATEGLYSHFTGVGRTPADGEIPPYSVDDAAVHHVFEGGWVWVLRFNNGITSAGVTATRAVAAELMLSEGEPAWHRVLDRLPALKAQFRGAKACQPLRYTPAVSFRSNTITGKRWAMLPSAAGFVDPLFSTGFALSLMGIERLARVLDSGFDSAELSDYAEQTESDLLAASRIIGAMYATMGNFEAFVAVSLIYFAAVSFAETAHRLGKSQLATGFLLHRHSEFGPALRVLLERAHRLNGVGETQAFVKEVRRVIEPFNLGGFGEPARRNWYAVVAEDLFDAGHKLGASREEMAAMLDRAGFYGTAAVIQG